MSSNESINKKQKTNHHNQDNMDKCLIVNKTDLNKWKLLAKIDQETRNLVKLFKPHGDRLWAALKDGRFIQIRDDSDGYEEISDLKGKTVLKIVAGANYAMVLDEKRQLWWWRQTNTSRITLILHLKVVDVKCGGWHTLVLVEGGKVMAWGSNRHGQLGIGNTNNKSELVPIPTLENKTIRMIEAGVHHSIAVTTDDKVYGWGGNESRQLGLGNQDDQLTPVRVDVADESVESVACSRGSTIFLTRNKLVYLAGGIDRTQLRLVNMQEQPEKIFAIIYAYHHHDFRSFERLFLASAPSKIFYWGNTSQDNNFSPRQADDCLSEVITQHSKFQSFPVTLHVEEASSTTGSDSNDNLKIKATLSSPSGSSFAWDITFVFKDGNVIKANRNMLSAVSNYISTRLSTEWRNKSVVNIADHPHAIYSLYLSYLYNLPFPQNLSLGQTAELLVLSRSHFEPSLAQACTHLLTSRLTIESACRLYEIAFELRLDELQNQALAMIRDNLEQVRQTEACKRMKAEAYKDCFSKL